MTFNYTPLIPRIDELFNVPPNVYGNEPRDQAERNSIRHFRVTGAEERRERRYNDWDGGADCVERVGFFVGRDPQLPYSAYRMYLAMP